MGDYVPCTSKTHQVRAKLFASTSFSITPTPRPCHVASECVRIYDRYGRFQIVSEIDVILESKRSTSVHAVRDSLLAKVPLSVVHRLHSLSPTVLPRLQRKARPPRETLDVIGTSVRRKPNGRPYNVTGGKFGTIAIVPISEDVPVSEFTSQLVESLRELSEHAILHLTKESVIAATGKEPGLCNAEEYHGLLEWITQQEMLHPMVSIRIA